MTDVRLYQTDDGGEIDYVNGQAVMSDGLGTAGYLSLFGGNEEDSGLEADDLKQWWGNFSEVEPEKRYRSETQYLLNTLPLTPNALPRIEDAAKRDLAWLVDTGILSDIVVSARIPALNRIAIEVYNQLGETVFSLQYTRQMQ